jgi:hypothetical protein
MWRSTTNRQKGSFSDKSLGIRVSMAVSNMKEWRDTSKLQTPIPPLTMVNSTIYKVDSELGEKPIQYSYHSNCPFPKIDVAQSQVFTHNSLCSRSRVMLKCVNSRRRGSNCSPFILIKT